MQKSHFRIAGILIIGVLAGINLITLHDGHNWGGDFSQYIIHSRNISEGKPYASGIMLDLPVVYPPGFPLLLSPLVKIFGVNFKIFKLLNVLFWFSSIWIIFKLLLRRVAQETALLCAILLSCSSLFFLFKQNVLSDIPFLFFTLCSIFVFEKYAARLETNSPKQRALLFIVAMALMGYSFLLRSAGAILFVSAALYLAVNKKRWKDSLMALGAMLLVVITQGMWIGIHKGFFSHFAKEEFISMSSIVQKSFLPMRSLFLFFCPIDSVGLLARASVLEPMIMGMAYIGYALILVYFFYGLKKRTLSFVGYFFALSLGMLIVWAGTPVPRDIFSRFIFPLIYPAMVLGREGTEFLFTKLRRPGQGRLWVNGILGLLIILNLGGIAKNFRFNDDILHQEQNQTLFIWLKENLSEGDHFMFWEPRVLSLMTGRMGTVPDISATGGKIFLYERIKKYNISYIVTIKDLDSGLIGALEASPGFYGKAWENNAYKIFFVKK